MLNLTRQERLVIQFLALFFVIGSAIHLFREKTGPDKVIELSGNVDEVRDFNAQADKIDSLYFSDQTGKSSKDIASQSALQVQKINLNTASVEELMQLPKIGEVTARRIIDYRTAHNGFTSISELVSVKGIGEKTVERIKKEVSIE